MNESRRQFYRNTESEPRWASPASGYFYLYDPGNPFFFNDPVYVGFLINCSAQRALSLRKFYYFLTSGWHLKLKNSGSSYLMSSQQACRSSLATLPLLCLVFRRKDDWVDWVFLLLWWNVHNIKCTILKWHWVHLHYCTTITAKYPQNSFTFPNWNCTH